MKTNLKIFRYAPDVNGKASNTSGGCFSRGKSRFRSIVEQAKCDGLSVLPNVRDPADKHPAIEWKEFQVRAPTDAEFRSWIDSYPGRNGLYLTGPASRRFILDLDDAAAVAWARRRGLPKTPTLLTRRGRHLHFVYPDFRVANSTGKIHEHADVRGAGGVAVAAGSIHATGFVYRWARGRSPKDVKLAKAPKWLLDWLRTQIKTPTATGEALPFKGVVAPYVKVAIERELEALANAPQGTRNDALARVAFNLGRWAGGGEADGAELIERLEKIAGRWPNSKKSLDTIVRCFESGKLQPRNAPPSLEQTVMEMRQRGW